jgi:hypothetical protein
MHFYENVLRGWRRYGIGMLVATRCRKLLRLGVFQASPNNQRMERGHRNDGKYHLISDSCYLFILSAKLRSSALVVWTVDRAERSRGVPTGHNASRASASLDLRLFAWPPRRLRSSSQGSRKSPKSDRVFS